MASATATKNNNGKKATSQTWEEGHVKETVSPAAPDPSPEPAPVAEAAPATPAPAAKKTRKKGQRTPLTTRLEAAPTPARKAIIIEEQLKMVDRRRKSILALVGKDVLDNVDPSLLS
jgi:hypothetical protein